MSEDNQNPLIKLAKSFLSSVPFSRSFGLDIISIEPDMVQTRFLMQEHLVGNYTQGILHGGAISTVLDTTGALMVLTGVFERLNDLPIKEVKERMSKVGTIDMRVDYLRPGLGKEFTASAVTLRSGNKVAVTRMELHNDTDSLIAVGTGTYIVG